MKHVQGTFGILREECLRIFTNWRFYVSIGLYLLVCFLIVRVEHLDYSVQDIQEYMINISNLNKLLVLIAAFPTACIFCDDWLGNYWMDVRLRCGDWTYRITKYLICVIVTFITCFVGMVLFCALLRIQYPMTLEKYEVYQYNGGRQYYGFLFGSVPFLYAIVRAVFFSMTASIHAAFGLVLSVWLPNRFVAVMAPMFSNFIIEELTYILPKYLYIGRLRTGLVIHGVSDPMCTLCTVCVDCGYVVIAGALFCHLSKKRLQNEFI